MSTAKFNTLEFLANPDRWPNWPVCPVKRSCSDKQYIEGDDRPQCGVVFDQPKPTVYRVNMFSIGPSTDLTKFEKHEYESLEALVADGWVVD